MSLIAYPFRSTGAGDKVVAEVIALAVTRPVFGYAGFVAADS